MPRYLMTDTLAVRKQAQAMYGSKLVSFENTTIEFYQKVTKHGEA